MVAKALGSRIGSPHSSHSGGVSGSVSSIMVASASTNGTSATIPANSSGASLATTPIRRPPALPPCATIRPAPVYPSAIRCRAAARKSENVFGFLPSLPSSYQRQPLSVPPRTCAMAVDEAAVDEREAIAREARIDRIAVGAVAIEKQRRRAVMLCVPPHQKRHRHGLAVGGRREHEAGLIARRVEAGRDDLPLDQRPLARGAVIVVDLLGPRHRRNGETDARRVELVDPARNSSA